MSIWQTVRSRGLALAITFLCTSILWVDWFFGIGNPAVSWLTETSTYLVAFSIGIGVVALTIRHSKIILQKKGQRELICSVITLVSFYATIILGVIPPIANNPIFNWAYLNLNVPIDISLGGTVAFLFISMIYRTFIVRNKAATLVMAAALVTLLGNTPLGEAIWPGIPRMSSWLLSVPSAAAFRAVLMGTGVGLLVTTLRTILGRQQGYP